MWRILSYADCKTETYFVLLRFFFRNSIHKLICQSIMAPVPFNISVPQEKIDALKRKLSLATFPDELNAAGWDLGCPLADIKRLTKAWEQWNWKQAEERLNKVPQFTADVEVSRFGTVNIHFVHQKSDVKGAIPLLFVHGCELLKDETYFIVYDF